MVSGAFVLVLVDIITPATEERWNISKTFRLLDEMVLRGIIPAGLYKEDLVELNNLRIKLRASNHDIEATPNTEAVLITGGEGTIIQQDLPPPQLEQDVIWSWMATENIDFGCLHPDTLQSAIDGLNFDTLTARAPSLMDYAGDEWMWRTGASPSQDQNWPDIL